MLAVLPAHQVIGDGVPLYSPSPRLSTGRTHRHSTSDITPPAEVSFARSFHRHSTNLRRPARSSPLAGPVLQLNSPIVEVDEEDKNDSRPPRVSSTPDFALILSPPPARIIRPKTADGRYYNRGLSSSIQLANAAQPSCEPEEVDVEKKETGQLESSNARRRSLHSLSSIADSIGSRKSLAQSSVIRPESIHGYSGFSDHNQGNGHIPKCLPPNGTDNSWFTTNPYETTPKFTRLSLASSNVVLPVSAKQSTRLNHKDSKTRVPVTSTATRLPQSRNLSASSGNLRQKKSGSPTSSTASDLSATLPYSSNTPSSTSTATSTVTSLAETDGNNQRKETRPFIVTTFSGKGSIARMKSFGLRSIKSAINVREQSPSSSSPAATDKKPGPPPNEVKVEIYDSRPDLSRSAPGENRNVLPPSSPVAKKSIKNLWKSLKNWRHHFSPS